MGVDRDALAAWVEASCHSQGVPVHVSDPGVLTRVRTLVGVGMPVRGGSAAGRGRAQAPDPYSTHTG
jgi:hypothetical protein